MMQPRFDSFLKRTCRALGVLLSLVAMVTLSYTSRSQEIRPGQPNKEPSKNPPAPITSDELAEVIENLELLRNFQLLKNIDFFRNLQFFDGQSQAMQSQPKGRPAEGTKP